MSLRNLTFEEVILVAGGLSSETIVVHGPGSGLNPGDVTPVSPGGDNTPTDNGSGTGGGSGFYTSYASSSEANHFADEHLHNYGTTLADANEYTKAHDDLARLYDFAKISPTYSFDIGNGHSMSAQSAISALSNTTIIISPFDAGSTGARNNVNANGSGITIAINPESDNQHAYNSNFTVGTGTDYVIFHEIGHALNYYAPGGSFSGDAALVEAAANTAGRSMELALGIGLMQSGGNLVDPGYGYN